MSGITIACGVIGAVCGIAGAAVGIYGADASADAKAENDERCDKQESLNAQGALRSEMQAKVNKAKMLAESANGISKNRIKGRKGANANIKTIDKKANNTDNPIDKGPSAGKTSAGSGTYFSGETVQ